MMVSKPHFELQKQIAEYCEVNHIFGMLRVMVKDGILFELNLGLSDIESKTAFTKDSMFSLYSLSKPFCAIGLLRLYDLGLVDLESHPSRYVPEADGFDKSVTIRHMLHHISGLPDFELISDFKEKYAPGYARFTREHLKLLTQYPSYFEAGTHSKYTNINFILLALIIENVSGKPYSEYMQAEVFEPLGMETAIVDNEKLAIPHRVTGYELWDNVVKKIDKSHDWLLGAGDIVATVDDVYCLNKAIKYRLLLKRETWEQVLTPSAVNNFGMGCTVTDWHGKKRITHNGGHLGFRTLHIQLPEDDFDIIFLSNSGFGNAREDISEMIYTAFYGNDTSAFCGEKTKMDEGYIDK